MNQDQLNSPASEQVQKHDRDTLDMMRAMVFRRLDTEGIVGRADMRHTVREKLNGARQDALIAARVTIREGTRVKLTNGLTGTVMYAMKTRFKVRDDNNKIWMVPPSCMHAI